MHSRRDYEGLVAKQQARKDDTRRRVLKAMRTIRAEIGQQGLYPQNEGKVTLTEVSKRAGIGATTLRNPHHRKTRERVQKWLSILGGRAATTKGEARRASREKLVWYEDALRKVNAEALKWRKERADLRQENQELREQINTMSANTGTQVLGFKSRSDRNA